MKNILQIFKEENGQWSMRRVLALLCVIFAAVLAFFSIQKDGWYVYIPTVLFIVCALFLLFFTTWEEVCGLIAAAKGTKD